MNDWVLTTEMLASRLARKLHGLPPISARDENLVNQTKNRIVQEFIVQSLVRDFAARNNIFVRKETLDAEIEKIRKQYPDDYAFRQALADSDLAYKVWVDDLQITLLEKQVLEEIQKKAGAPTDKELQEYYKKNKSEFKVSARVKISQILSSTEENAKLIRKKLRQGAKFEELAKKYSIGPEAKFGGDIGWIEKGSSEMYDYAFRLGVGQISRILKTPAGYVIFKLKSRRSGKTLRFKNVKERINGTLLAEKEREIYSKWLESELLQARVFKDEELIRAIRVHARSTN